ncbi:hypothetical protein HDV00_001942 [Rhizophlyctis rosea]|nr:hypothetical protein HDV00_001942 [Rhizophlyctis rosea]
MLLPILLASSLLASSACAQAQPTQRPTTPTPSTYVGCRAPINRKWADPAQLQLDSITPTTMMACNERCGSYLNMKYFAITPNGNERQCRCVSDPTSSEWNYALDLYCNATCPDDGKSCGGQNAEMQFGSLYAIGNATIPPAPTEPGRQMGCYNTNGWLTSVNTDPAFTEATCYSQCYHPDILLAYFLLGPSANGTIIANGTMGCGCAHYSTAQWFVKVDDALCDSTCISGGKCGSATRSLVNVYAMANAPTGTISPVPRAPYTPTSTTPAPTPTAHTPSCKTISFTGNLTEDGFVDINIFDEWSNPSTAFELDVTTNDLTSPAYRAGATSPPYVLYNGWGNNADFYRKYGLFNITGLYATAAFIDELTVVFEGYNMRSTKYSKSFQLSTTQPTFCPLDFVDIDQLRVRTEFGSGVPLDHLEDRGTQVVMDDWEICE